MHETPVLDARFSHDSRRIVTVAADGTIGVWDAKYGLPLSKSPRNSQPIGYAHFDSNDRAVIIGSSEMEPSVVGFVLPPHEIPEHWLQIVDATAGFKLNDKGNPEQIPFTELRRIRREMAATTESGTIWQIARRISAEGVTNSVELPSTIFVPR